MEGRGGDGERKGEGSLREMRGHQGGQCCGVQRNP